MQMPMPDDDDKDVGSTLKRDFGGLFRAIGRFAEHGIAGLAPDEEEAPPPMAAQSSGAAPPRARPVVVDVESTPAGACSYCGTSGGGGRLETRGRDGRVRLVPCPDCGDR